MAHLVGLIAVLAVIVVLGTPFFFNVGLYKRRLWPLQLIPVLY